MENRASWLGHYYKTKMCDFREQYALNKITSMKMADLRPLLTLVCIISGILSQIAGLLV